MSNSRSIYIISNCFLLMFLAVLYDSLRVFFFGYDFLLVIVHVTIMHNILLTLILIYTYRYFRLRILFSVVITSISCIIILDILLNSYGMQLIIPIMIASIIFMFGVFFAVRKYNWVHYIFVLVSFIIFCYYIFPQNSVADEQTSDFQFSDSIQGQISFVDKPNIYFISFDGMTARSLLYEMTGIKDSSYHDTIDSNFSVYSPAFSNAYFTDASISALLTMGLKEIDFNNVEERKAQNEYFTGVADSPFFHILRENDYEIHTIYSNKLFGDKQGTYVDGYHLVQNRSNLCSRLSDFYSLKIYFLYSYCGFVDVYYDKILNYSGADSFVWESLGDDSTISRVIQIASESEVDSNLFLMAHINVPYHTEGDYDIHDKDQYDKFVGSTEEKLLTASKILDIILNYIQRNDPNAILFVYGDHGLLRDTKNETYDSHPDYVMKNRYGTLAAIYPKMKCKIEMQSVIDDKGYLTLVDAYHAILRCLSQKSTIYTEQGLDIVGELDKPLDWNFSFDLQPHMRQEKNHILYYKDFLYPYNIEIEND